MIDRAQEKEEALRPAKLLSALADMGLFAFKDQVIQVRAVCVSPHPITSLFSLRSYYTPDLCRKKRKYGKNIVNIL